MSFSSEDELAAVEGEAFFQSLVEDADAGPTAAADSGDLEPQLDAEIGSELQISAQIPAMQAQAQMHQQDQYQGEDWVAGDVPPETISTTATPSVAAPTDAVTAATAVPPTIASIAQESPAHIQVLDSTQELDDQLHYQQQRQQPAPATIASAVTSTPEDGFSPVPVVAQQSSISDATSLNTINTNDDTNPVLMQETVPAIPSELPDQSLDPSGWTPHSRNPSQDLSATTISADATISTQLMSNPPSSIPCGTPVEYYRPDPSAPAIATAHFVKENQAQIPAATVNTEEGLGLQTSYSEVPAPTTVVMNREEYEDLGELPKPQRDMPVLSDAEVNAGVSDVEGDVDVDAGIEAEAGVSVATGHNTQQDPVQSQEQQSQDGGVGASMDTGLSGQSTTEAHEPSDVEVPSIQQEVVATQGENSAISISDDTAAIDAVLQQATPIQEQSPANIPPAQEIPVESTSITDFTATQLPGASMNINEPSTEGITTATANPVTDDITQPAPQFVSPSQQDMESMSTDRRPSIQISVASTADESMMSEKDLEERWKAMGIDDAELLDDMMLDPEEDIPVQQLDTPLSQQTPALPTNASSVPSQQPASTAAQVSAQAQLSPQPVVQNPPTNPYIPQQAIAPLSAPASRQPSNSYAPHQPSVSELVEGLPAPSPLVKPHEPALRRTSLGLPTAAASGYSPAQPKVKQPPSVSSFVDKTKEGYQSPYDLPAEFTRPVRRAHPAQPVQRVQGQPQMQGLKAGPPPLQQARLPTTVQGGVVPPIRSQQQPRSVSSSYKPAHPQSRTVPAPVFAPPPPVSRQSAIASPPPSAGNNASFHRGSASQDSKGVGGDNAGAGKITVAASVPSPPATPPGTAPVQMQPQPEPVQSAARSKYAPPSTISVSIQSASIPQPSPTFATPPSQATHRRVSSLTKVGAETGAPTPPSVDVAAQRVPSPKNREVSMTGPQQVLSSTAQATMQPSPSSLQLSSLAQAAVTPASPAPIGPDYIVPDDGQELDPLQRWKGAPIFRCGFGGVVCSIFPRQVPKYLAGHALPKMKPMPGEIRVGKMEDMAATAGISIESAGFPGPLTSKSKKKEVLTWMDNVISLMEGRGDDAEDVLLWKVMRLLVDNDGVLSGTPAILDAACALMCPNEIPIPQEESENSAGQVLAEVTKPDALLRIQNHLMAGLRENAVWEAADNRLWGHALLLSSSLEDKSVWKRVTEEFVQRELSSLSKAQPLAALYEVLAGNPVESVDQLVPPSARAGLQMVNKTGSTRASALDGLNQWRETVVLILRNMSPEGPQSLIEISQLLASFGRTSASHICALFAKSLSGAACFSGPDDPQALVALLGWDHRRQSGAVANNLSSILLTEIYEFATSILNTQSAPTTLPYLQAFKLLHAEWLAELGDISQALDYCDGFATTLKKSGHRPSPYYHTMLVSRWEDLHSRLVHLSPEDSHGWMSKPSMSKVTGSVWTKFQNFIAGEDENSVESSDAPAPTEEIGILSSPAQQIVSGQSLAPQPFPQPIYNSPIPSPYPTQPLPSRYTPQPKHTPSNSREMKLSQGFASTASLTQYIPGASNTAPVVQRSRKASQLSQAQSHTGRPSIDSTTSAATSSMSRYMPAAQVDNPYTPTSGVTQTASRAVQSYSPLAPQSLGHVTTQDDSSFTAAKPEARFSETPDVKSLADVSPSDSVIPTVAADGETVAGSSEASQQGEYGGYMPPTPDMALSESSSSASQSGEDTSKVKSGRRSSILEDDEDDRELLKRAAALKKAEEKRKDQEATEKAKNGAQGESSAQQQKKGWFSGWFGGKKESASPATVIRAKLGEENSFYYDKDLKRWVNNKDPNGAASPAGTLPPPPKASAPAAARHKPGNSDSSSPTTTMPASAGPPPTSASTLGLAGAGAGAGEPPNTTGLKSPVKSTPNFRAVLPPPPRSSSTVPEVTSASPVPRDISNAESLDELLGAPAPTPRTHTAAKSKRKGRGYVDLMAK